MRISIEPLPYKKPTRYFVMTIGDTHIGSEGFCGRHFSKMCDRAEELSKIGEVFFIVGGDLEDDDRPTSRIGKICRTADRLDEWRRDAEKHKRDMFHRDYGTIAWLEKLFRHGKVLGGVAGDHWMLYPDGSNSAQFIADYFKYPYLGTELGAVRLKFIYECNAKSRNKWGGSCGAKDYDIVFFHGKGGTRAEGGHLRAILSGIGGSIDADMIVRFHSHQLETKPVTRLYIDKSNPPQLKEKKTYILNNGSSLRGYIQGKETYAELANYKPATLAWGEAELSVHKSENGTNVSTRIMYS